MNQSLNPALKHDARASYGSCLRRENSSGPGQPPTRGRISSDGRGGLIFGLKWGLAAIVATLLGMAGAKAADRIWIGGTGSWNAAANWSPAQVPTAADTAIITNVGTYTVTVPDRFDSTIGALMLGGATGNQTLSLGRAVLTLNGASAINRNGQLVLTVGNSTVTGPGHLTVNGALSCASGTLSGSGGTTIGGGGVMTIGGGVTFVERALNNAGRVSWNSGNFTVGDGAVLNNLAGGIFEVTFGGRLNVSAAPATFNNAGLFRKTGALTANLILPFHNAGTVAVQGGTLSLDDGGTQTGSFGAGAGAVMALGGGDHVLVETSIVSGPGTFAVNGGATTVSARGRFAAGSELNVTAGTTVLLATCDVSDATVTVGGGVLTIDNNGLVGVMNVSGGVLGGVHPVTVAGLLTLSGGSITSALVTAGGGLHITGGVTLDGGKLVNPGLAVWSAGNFVGANGAIFSNLVGATFINTFDGNARSGAGATPIWVNDGTFQKTNGTAALGSTSIDFQFVNTGTVEVRTNTLRYAANQQSAGLTLLRGGRLAAQAQPIQILGGSLVGPGVLTVANDQNVINAATISPGPGRGELTIAGNYQQTASGILNINLGGYSPGIGYERVTVAAGGAGGVATLDGTLNVNLVDGFSPTNGATFTFLNANSRAGVFSTFSYPSNDIGMEVTYDLVSAKVTVTNLKPVVANPIVDPADFTYGSPLNFQFPADAFLDPDLTPLSYSALGLPPGVAFDPVTRTFSGAPTQVGTFSVTVMASDGGNPGLSVTQQVTFVVKRASLTGSFTAASRAYDGTARASVLTRELVGLVSADLGQVSLAGGTAAFADANAGVDKIVTLAGGTLSGSKAANYQLTSVEPGRAAITPAPLVVSADPKTKVFGAADPTFTASMVGFVNGETGAVLGGTLTFTRAPDEGVGRHPVTPGGVTSANYAITFNPGFLTITAPRAEVSSGHEEGGDTS